MKNTDKIVTVWMATCLILVDAGIIGLFVSALFSGVFNTLFLVMFECGLLLLFAPIAFVMVLLTIKRDDKR